MITLRPHQERILDRMLAYNKGQMIVPTGGGKTLTMIMDTQRRHDVITHGTTTVVVAPRILLAEQLCSEFLEVIDTANTHIMHVHSGETHHYSSTKADNIHVFANTARTAGENVIIFTTYNSLDRLRQADIEVNTIYFDEAHNSVQRHFFPATEFFSSAADRCYFYTATRKTSVTINKPGMNDREVYGDILERVPAPELVAGGFIVPPKVKVIEMDKMDKKSITPFVESNNILTSLEELSIKKVLVCAKTTKQLITLFQTDFASQLKERGYSYLYITSKTGAVIDGQKVSREEFFKTLNAWGRQEDKKFVVLHRSILSEGINISQLEGVIFMRNMNTIEMTQSIGRVLRLADKKSFGFCCVPVYSQVGVSTARALQKCVDVVFEKGELYDSVARR
jgi:superfamily II DNA or RNA helicase